MNQATRSTTPQPLQGEAALIRAVGTFALTAAVINVIVGGGIFRMPSALSAQMGAAAPLALLAGAIAIIPIALCFAAVGSRVQVTGGPYSYLAATFGPFAGFLAGALMWISNFTSSAGVAAALSVQVANLAPVFAPPLPRALLITGIYVVLFALNAFGVKMGARAITALAALKLTPLFLLAALGVFFVDWSLVSFSPAAAPSFAALGASMALVMFAYSGMETALVPSGELENAARSVPRAALVAILLVVLLYLGLQIVGQGVLGAKLGESGVPVADTAGALWAPGRTLLLVTACISMTGFLMGNLLGTSRLVFALGRDGYLPAALARVSAVHRVPVLALVVHAGLAWILALASVVDKQRAEALFGDTMLAAPARVMFGGGFDKLALISGGAICLVYFLVALSAWVAQRRDLRERGDHPFVLPAGALVPVLAMLAMVAIVFTLKLDEILAIVVAMAVLVVVYALLHARRRSA